MAHTKRFTVIAIAALLWNIMGDAAYLMQVTMDLDTLAKTDPYQARMFAVMPSWLWSAYAIAVWVGTLAAIFLLMRRRISVPLYLVSLIAVILQFGYTLGATDLLAVKGISAAIFPAVVISLTLAQLVFAARMQSKGVLR